LPDVDRQQVEERLAQREREIEERRASVRSDEPAGGDELADYDNHPGDQGTETFMQEMDETTAMILDDEAERVKQARQLLEEGRYGTCIVCGKDIPAERLEAVPESVRCIDDQRVYEARLRQGGGPAATH
jgi:DnaK suppressor protein